MSLRNIAIGVALFATTALAKSQTWTVQLDWQPSPASEAVTNYGVYVATGTNLFALQAQPTTNSVVLTNVVPGAYKYRVTARNVWGEGPPSAEVATPPGLPAMPLNLKFNITISVSGP